MNLLQLTTPLGVMVLAENTQNALCAVWSVGQKHFPAGIEQLYKIAPKVQMLFAGANGYEIQEEKSTAAAISSTLRTAAQELAGYFSGTVHQFSVPCMPAGTPFQLQVWQALTHIPYGTVCTYSDIANEIGNPAGVRAVGGAIGRNPLGIIVPCHRVIGKDGSLTGFAGGIDRKEALLNLERKYAGV